MLSILNGLESSVSKTGSITMQELERADIIAACTRGEMKATVAAQRLQISTRQVRRLQKRLAEGGVSAMMSAQRGKPSNNQLAPSVAKTALQLVREHYADFGPTLACEQLQDRHGVVLSKETLRHLMIDAGLWIPKSARRTVLHRPRERRPCFGELVQIDGSLHRWFEHRGPACTLLVYVDDATGKLLQLHFAETESTTSYFEATRRYLERHGKPQALYSDRAAVFRSPLATSRTCTQFQRALNELDIELICANSPQAKGRVERANRTLQDRLVKQMRLDGINDIDGANAWCDDYVVRYNARFARTAISNFDAHTPLHASDNLDLVLTNRVTRKLSTKLVLQHGKLLYLLDDTPQARGLIGQTVAIHTYADDRVELRANGELLTYTSLPLPALELPTDVDSKSVRQMLDKKIRNRRDRENRSTAERTQGVGRARKLSAQPRV
jgi:transposase